MEQYLLKTPEFYREYNCSFYHVDDIPIEKRSHVFIGTSFIVMFFISAVFYILALSIMRRPEFYSKPCYKIMFFMGINDVVCIIDNGFLMGYFDINGFTYCSAPNFLYIHGAAGLSMWGVQSTLGILLASNRCIEMFNPQINKHLFDGIRVYLWILLIFLYGLSMGFFSRPPIYSSLFVSLFPNPHFGYFEDYELKYTNLFHCVHNIAVLVLLALCYMIFIILIVRKSGVKFNASLKDSLYQVFIICIFNTIPAGEYVYMNFFPVPEWLIIFAQYTWFFAHAGPALIYSIFNRSIRRQIIGVLRLSNSSITPSNPNLVEAGSQQHA